MTPLPLLMTASVSTRGMKGACFSDTEREDMYVNALSYYITKILNTNPSQKIIFAENSGWSLNSFKVKLPKHNPNQIEWISLNPDSFDISKGKGYNEVILINNTIAQSSFIQESQ